QGRNAAPQRVMPPNGLARFLGFTTAGRSDNRCRGRHRNALVIGGGYDMRSLYRCGQRAVLSAAVLSCLALAAMAQTPAAAAAGAAAPAAAAAAAAPKLDTGDTAWMLTSVALVLDR